MANPLPCKICETNNVLSLSDWLVTAQSENQGFPVGTTFYVCIPCLAGLMVGWLQEQEGEPTFVDPAAPLEGEGPADEPGVLELIEGDEGKVTPQVNGRGRKSRGQGETGGETVEAATEAETADVHE